MHRLTAVLIGAALALAVPRMALACGVWKLEDRRAGSRVSFLVSSVKVSKPEAGTRTAIKILGHPHRFTAIRGKWKRGKKPILAVDGQSIRLRDEVVAAMDGGTLTIGEQRFSIAVTEAESEGVHRYRVVVSDSDGEFADAEAMSFWQGCREGSTDAPEADAAIRLADVRNRVALYLVWRDLVDRS